MSMPVKVTFLKALDGELERAPILKFRLYYEGELRATNWEPREGQREPKAAHKHEIRRCFHKQLKRLWDVNSFLKYYKRHQDISINSRLISNSGMYCDAIEDEKIPLMDYISSRFITIILYH